MSCFHINVRHKWIHDVVVSHRNGWNVGGIDRSEVRPISICASSTSTVRSIPVGNLVHMWSTNVLSHRHEGQPVHIFHFFELSSYNRRTVQQIRIAPKHDVQRMIY